MAVNKNVQSKIIKDLNSGKKIPVLDKIKPKTQHQEIRIKKQKYLQLLKILPKRRVIIKKYNNKFKYPNN